MNHIFVLQLTKEAEEKVSKSRALIDDIVKESKTVYGITTGFGKFARTVIEKKKLEYVKNLSDNSLLLIIKMNFFMSLYLLLYRNNYLILI